MRSSLKNKVLYSPLASHSTIQPHGQKTSKGIVSSLLLTSLVDAFSILAIFLMMNSASDSVEVNIGKNLQLPSASKGESAVKTTVVRVERSKFFVNDKAVSESALERTLVQLQKSLSKVSSPVADSLVIVADRELDYGKLNPLIVLGSRAGFNQFKFAVIRDQTK